VIAVKYKRALGSKSFPLQLRLLIIVFAAIFLSEFVIMLLIQILFAGISWVLHIILDTLFLTLVIIPALYKFLHRPMTSHIKGNIDIYEVFAKMQEMYNLHLDNATDIISLLNEEGIIKYQNPSVERILGYKHEENTGKSIFDLIYPQDLQRVVEFFRKYVKIPGITPTIEYRMWHKDGSLRYLESVANNLLYHQDVKSIIVNSRDISERKVLEERMKENEQRYRSIFENNHAVMLLISPKTGDIKDVNSAAVKFYGYSKEQLLKMKISDLNTRSNSEIIKAMDLVIKNNGSHFQFRHRLASNEVKDVDVYCGEIIIKDEKLLYSIVHDISERIKAEQLLKSSKENYRLLVENSPAGIITCDIDGNITNANNAVLKMLGESCLGEPNNINVITYKALVDCGFSTDIKKCLKTGETIINECSYNSNLGKEVYLRSHLTPMHGASGKIIGVQGIITDLTERKNYEDELRKLNLALEQSPVTVIITDYEGKIEYVNSKFTKTTGYTYEEVLGQNPRILKSGEKSIEEYKELWDTIKSGREWRGEFHNKKKNGELFWESASISPVFSKAGKITHFVDIKEDITKRKQKEQEMNYMAFHDVLTGLPNRILFQDRLVIAIANSKRYNKVMAVMFLDLDGFKFINDTFGHDAGDKLLQEVAKTLKEIVCHEDTVARIGGDEFTFIFPKVDEVEAIEVIADRILDELKKPLTELELKVTASIGIAFYPEHGTKIGELLKNADAAMYKAKELGKNNYKIFN
jgi:diguanylate cyclase (GGDEF)-like protein/PAS domain S-box-containing protein